MSAVLKDIHTGASFGAPKARGRGADPVRSPAELTLQRQRDRAVTPAKAVRIANSTTREIYDGAELRAHVRPGALDAYRLPSLHGGRRVYPKRHTHGGTA